MIVHTANTTNIPHHEMSIIQLPTLIVPTIHIDDGAMRKEDEDEVTEVVDVPNKKRKYSDDVVKEMEDNMKCPVCLSAVFPDPDFKACANDHILCPACFPKLEKKECPLCKVKLSATWKKQVNAPKMAQKLLKMSRVDCPNTRCNHTCTVGDIVAHKKICSHRTAACPHCPDSSPWKGTGSEFKEHLVESHDARQFEVDDDDDDELPEDDDVHVTCYEMGDNPGTIFSFGDVELYLQTWTSIDKCVCPACHGKTKIADRHAGKTLLYGFVTQLTDSKPADISKIQLNVVSHSEEQRLENLVCMKPALFTDSKQAISFVFPFAKGASSCKVVVTKRCF